MSAETRAILMNSIVNEDAIIGATAIAELVAFILMLIFALIIKGSTKVWERKRNIPFSATMYHLLRFSNTVFVSLLSLFPLLGMLGTVNGLLGLDLSNGDMENIRANFFIALTSTAWGIIFSVLFKFFFAFFTDFVDDQLETSKKLSEKVNLNASHKAR